MLGRLCLPLCCLFCFGLTIPNTLFPKEIDQEKAIFEKEEADYRKDLHQFNFTIISYGVIETTVSCLRFVSDFFSSKEFQKLMAIGLMVGFLSFFIASAFFRPVAASKILHSVLISSLAFIIFSQAVVPVAVYDPIIRQSKATNITPYQKVEAVPLLLATVASVGSQIFDLITQKISRIWGSSENYTATGRIWAANLYRGSRSFMSAFRNLDREKMGEFERNFSSFCKTCVSEDLALNKNGRGFYSFRNLAESEDIMEFLSKETSSLRSTAITELGKERWLTCKAAASRLQGEFNSYISTHINRLKSIAAHPSMGILQGAFLRNNLTHNDLSPVKLFARQQVAINALNELGNQSKNYFFSKLSQEQVVRSQNIQKESVSETIASMQQVLMVLIYALFPLILLCCFWLSSWSYLANWFKGWLMIGLWQPLFAIVDGFANNRLIKKAGLASWGEGMSWLQIEALSEQFDICNTIAASLQWSVVGISVFIVYGGVWGLSGLAGKVTERFESAGSQAGSESARENLSYANTSVETLSAFNKQVGQVATAPRVSTLGSTVDHGPGVQLAYDPETFGTVFGGENQGPLIKQNLSHLTTSIGSRELVSNSLNESIHEQKQQMSSLMNEHGKGTAESLSNILDSGILKQNSQSTTEGLAKTDSEQFQQQVSQMEEISGRLQKNHGMNRDEAYSTAMSAGANIDFKIFKAGGDVGRNSSIREAEGWDDLLSTTEQTQVQGLYQGMQGFTKSLSSNESNSETNSLAENFRKMVDQSENFRENLQQSYSNLTSLQQAKNYVNSNEFSVSEDLTQPYVNFVSSKAGNDPARIREALNTKQYLSEFSSSHKEEILQSANINANVLETQKMELSKQSFEPNTEKFSNPIQGSYKDSSANLNMKFDSSQEQRENLIESKADKIEDRKDKILKTREESSSKLAGMFLGPTKNQREVEERNDPDLFAIGKEKYMKNKRKD